MDEFTYLGITLNYNGRLLRPAECIVAKARKAQFGLEKKLYRRYLPIGEWIRAYQATVEPILTYCGELWGPYHGKLARTAQLGFLKTLLGVRSTTKSEMIWLLCGTIPVETRLEVKCISYWTRFVDPTLPKKLAHKVYSRLLASGGGRHK